MASQQTIDGLINEMYRGCVLFAVKVQELRALMYAGADDMARAKANEIIDLVGIDMAQDMGLVRSRVK